ncbi:acetolactate decarboxylase [Paraherbaspirillum soli]|uniref:Alpha-acetolactate decarboxylase n=1 Tax=Paraherbaspirillum soli TaxID=631222 RepID=A0ABW0M9L9_9BURK
MPEPKAFQYSTIDALLDGAYEGSYTVDQLKQKGNFGIGTFNRVDGELVLVDGEVYKAKSDGTVELAAASEMTPFAVVTTFPTAGEVKYTVTTPTTLKELEDLLDKGLENKNVFYAIRIEGDFKQMTARAISPQDKPYKPLAEVAKTQSVFHYSDTNGVLVAFRSPNFSKGFNVTGYHWHFLSGDKKTGGHVLNLAMTKGVIKITPVSDIEIKIPTSDMFANTNQSIDRSSELKMVEGLRKN